MFAPCVPPSNGERDMATPLSEHAKGLGETAAAAADALSAQAKGMAQTATTYAQDAASKAADARDAVWETARKAGAQAQSAATDAYARGERTAQELARRVEERPL